MVLSSASDLKTPIAVSSELKATLRGRQLLSIGVGAIMGVGWSVVLGDWLTAAGPAGTVLGFLIGGLCMLAVAACYGELAGTLPHAGGEIVYLRAIFGAGASVVVGWFIVLLAVSVTAFEAIAVAWFLERFFPGYQGPVLYRILGADLRPGALALGVIGTMVVAYVNWRGAASAGAAQEIFTYLKAALLVGHAANFQPLLTHDAAHSTFKGIAWIAVTSPYWLGGFQIVPQAIEERASALSIAAVGRLTVATAAIGIVFYAAVVLAASAVLPRTALLGASIPAVSAIEAAFSGTVLAPLVLAAVVLGMLATWNATFLWATHLLLALGRQGSLPAIFARTGAGKTPAFGIAFVAIVGLAAVFLGRGALIPIVNMAAMSLSICYAVTCSAALQQRLRSPQLPRPFRVPWPKVVMPLAIGASAVMAVYALLEPWLRTGQIPLEWWLMFAWASLGGLLLRARRAESAGATRG
jgi:basic amino acid/polyamine antiporter, APA family